MSEVCFYEILGVSRSVEAKELKSAFRKLAMKFHPDRNPDNPEAEASFKEVTAAYECLSDSDKRAVYDRVGRSGYENGGMGGAGGGFGGQGGRPEDVFSDIFSEFFGGRRGGPAGMRKGADLRYDYEVTLEEAFAGKQVEIKLPIAQSCDDCSGSGAAPGSEPETCSMCAGAGRVRAQQGFFTMERTCTRCQGRGTIITKPCRTCDARGKVRAERKLQVNIPPGIEDHQKIRLEGEGEAGERGGPAGDLYIFVSVTEHEIFEREGTHLFTRAPVPMCKAALGGEIEMPTIDGSRANVKVPEGAQTGKRMRLRGKGMPNVHTGELGDLFVEIYVETPRNLNSRQKDLLREFSDECSNDTNPEHHGFKDMVKRFFDRKSGSA